MLGEKTLHYIEFEQEEMDYENAESMIEEFGTVLKTIPQIPSLPIFSVPVKDMDAGMNWGAGDPASRSYITKLGDYLPAYDIEKIDSFLAEIAEIKGYTLLGGTTADLVLGVNITEESVANYENNFARMGDYCCSVRVHDRYTGARKNLYKDWFITESERGRTTEISVKRAKELLGLVLQPDNLTYTILKAIEAKIDNSELKKAVPRILS